MTDTSAELTLILDDCLTALLAGECTLDDCLATYPQHAQALKPLLQAALLAHTQPQRQLTPTRIAALEKRLRLQAQPKPVTMPARMVRPWARWAAGLAIVFLLTMGAGGGAVAASASSLPGDPLYGLKRLWESIVIALASLVEASDDVWLRLAQTRLDEAEQLAARGTLTTTVYQDVYEATAQALLLTAPAHEAALLNWLKDANHRISQLPVTAATAPFQQDLLQLTGPAAAGQRIRPASIHAPSLQPTVMQLQPATEAPAEATSTATPTDAPPPITMTATLTATDMLTSIPPTVTLTPTSRVPDTVTPSPTATATPYPTLTATITPSTTWTPLPLPGAFVTPQSSNQTSQPRENETQQPVTQPIAATVQPEATIRHRETQAAAYATQTQQAASATEEVQP